MKFWRKKIKQKNAKYTYEMADNTVNDIKLALIILRVALSVGRCTAITDVIVKAHL